MPGNPLVGNETSPFKSSPFNFSPFCGRTTEGHHGTVSGVGPRSFLLLESGDYLLLEDGSKLILE